jgi:hypothetical protein
MSVEATTRLEQRVAELESQLATLTARLVLLETQRPPKVVYNAPHNSQEECESHQCSYYTGYLMYGEPDLTHEGFHAGEREGGRHIQFCAKGRCTLCREWEMRLRA